jgi:hypothetical protein
MPNYQQGKIYKLISPHSNKIYIGSTTKQYLSQRLTEHKNKYNLWINNKYHFVSSFDILSLGDVEIILLETYVCNTKDELTARERHWIEQNNELCINKYMPSRNQKERNNIYYQNNNEEIKQQTKDYYKKNKDEKLEYAKKYRNLNKEIIQEKQKKKYTCECGAITNIHHKLRHNQTIKHQTYLMIHTL